MAHTWNETNCFTEVQLKTMAEQGDIQSLTVHETIHGYIVVAEAKLNALNVDKKKWERKWLPATWRTRREVEPRLFSSLERLMDKLSETFPNIGTIRIEMLPPKERVKKQKLLEQRIPVDEEGRKEPGRPKLPKGKEAKKAVAKVASKVAKPK